MDKDQAKAAAKAACERALAGNPGKSQVHVVRLAVFGFIADELGAKKGSPDRIAAAEAFMATPPFFGGSANTLTTGFGLVEKGSREAVDEDYTNA